MGYREKSVRLSGIKVEVSCEACGHRYSFTSSVSIPGRGLHDFPCTRQGVLYKAALLTEGDLSVLDSYDICPQCGYTQSYMLEWRRSQRAVLFALPVGLFAGIVSAVTGLFYHGLHPAILGEFMIAGTVFGFLCWIVFEFALGSWDPNNGRQPSSAPTPPPRVIKYRV